MLIMENAEEVMQILERYTRLKQKDIPKELDDYLCYIAKTGDTVYRWSDVKYLFKEKLIYVIKDFHDTTASVDDLPQYPNVDPFNYEGMKSSLLERLDIFTAAPFTIQRLCELLTEPRKQYSRIDKFMRALEKNILVVSTTEPGRKALDSENGDSLDSVVNGDISLDVNVDIDMENESIFNIQPHNSLGISSVLAKLDASGDHKAAKKTKLEEAEKEVSTTDQESKSIIGLGSGDDPKIENHLKENLCNNSNSIEQTQDKIIKSNEKNIAVEPERNDDHKNDNEEIASTDESCLTSTTVENNDENVKENNEIIIKTNNDYKKESVTSAVGSELSESNENIQSVCRKNIVEADNEVEKESTVMSSINVEKINNVISSGTEDLSKDDAADQCNETEPESSTITNHTPTEKSEVLFGGKEEDKEDKEERISKNTKDNVVSSISGSSKLSKSQKNSEEMSIEETNCTTQHQSQEILSSTEVTQANKNQETIPDQPMDENPDNSVTSTCLPSNTCCADEVIMQTESDMTSDTDSVKLLQEKGDLGGMDVDDTSQEEAMDQ